MDKNYFGLVCEAISQANRIKNFKKIKKDESNFEFQANEKHYLINLDSQKKLIILNIIDDENNSSKNLSSWLFDEDTLTQKDIDDISSDFIETMSVKEKSSHKKSSKSQKNSSDDTNVNDMFFANRMVNFFPELKEKMQIDDQLIIIATNNFFTALKMKHKTWNDANIGLIFWSCVCISHTCFTLFNLFEDRELLLTLYLTRASFIP